MLFKVRPVLSCYFISRIFRLCPFFSSASFHFAGFLAKCFYYYYYKFFKTAKPFFFICLMASDLRSMYKYTYVCIVKDECGGGSMIYFCPALAFLHIVVIAYVCTYMRVFLFQSYATRMLHLVTFIVKIPQASIRYFFFPHSETITTSFSTLHYHLLKELRSVQDCPSLSFQMLVIALPLTLFVHFFLLLYFLARDVTDASWHCLHISLCPFHVKQC